MTEFNWTPGIGDPTPMGWLTVALYLGTAVAAWRVARRLRAAGAATQSEAFVWAAIAVLFLLLGINKQLDLQSAVTELGRVLAYAQGWYGQRYTIQVAFVAAVGSACLVAATVLLVLLRGAPAPAWLALFGTVVVMLFVTIRAASFHHIDRLIGTAVLGLRWNWILEIGGILIVLVATWRRR